MVFAKAGQTLDIPFRLQILRWIFAKPAFNDYIVMVSGYPNSKTLLADTHAPTLFTFNLKTCPNPLEPRLGFSSIKSSVVSP